VRAAEGIIHVTQDLDGGLYVPIRGNDLGDSLECAAAERDRPSGLIQESPAQSRGRSGAAVDCRAASDGQQDTLGSTFEGRSDELAGSVRRCDKGVSLVGVQQL
jgi:hypothetical protein